MTLLASAIRLARLGHPVLPLAYGGKAPLTAAVPRGLLDATTDVAIIRQWFRAHPTANLGMRCDRLLVLDLDGEQGEQALAELERGHVAFPPTREQRTPNGGRHLLYRLPAGIEVGNSTAALGSPPGLDLRAGQRGYIVVSPSRLGERRCRGCGDRRPRWTWTVPERPIAAAPGWLLAALARPPRAAPIVPPTPSGETSRYGQAALAAEAAAVEAAAEGTRNETLVRAAFRLGQLEAGGEIAYGTSDEPLLAAACRAGLPADEARRTVRSGLDAGREHPRRAQAHASVRSRVAA